jgi:drug/metabolite transporter (DMT)-like permease
VTGHDIAVVVLALAAALLFSASNVLEQHVARRAPEEQALRPGLLVYLARQRLWLLGIVADVGGYVCQAAALGIGLVVVVQPIGSTALLFSLALDMLWSKRKMRKTEWATAALLAASLGLFLAQSSPSGGVDQVPFREWLAPGLGLTIGILLCILVAQRASGVVRASLLALAAGTMFGITAPLTKSFVHLLGGGPAVVLSNWEPYALAVFSIAGLIVLQSAFQAGALQASLPFVETAEPLVACFIGLALFGERLHANTWTDKCIVVASAVTMLVCAVSLARAQGEREQADANQAIAAGRADMAVS